jgi:parvulin-like peptidyl-prolyl isomerase
MAMIPIKRAMVSLAAAAGLLAPASWGATGPAAEGGGRGVFAVVDGTVISTRDFEAALAGAIRQKFYHRRPPEAQLVQLRQDVTDGLVNRVLLLREAQQRGIQPDEEKVRKELAAFEQRNRDRPQWQEARAELLPALTQALQEQSIIARLEAATRVASWPTEAALRAYYDLHPEQFTEPERVRLSMTLLKVDPAAPAAALEQALAKAQELVGQLAAGADFAETARLHSDDTSAREGGDLGYRHRGTLPRGVEAAIANLALGAISEPLRLLEGIAVLRLVDRKAAQLRSLEDVRRSVVDLWARE